MIKFYRLDPETHEVYEVEHPIQLEGELNKQRIVAKDAVGDAWVSTVFTALDHNMGKGRSLFFQTMVFSGVMSGHLERCSTYDEALVMHQAVVDKVKNIASLKTLLEE